MNESPITQNAQPAETSVPRSAPGRPRRAACLALIAALTSVSALVGGWSSTAGAQTNYVGGGASSYYTWSVQPMNPGVNVIHCRSDYDRIELNFSPGNQGTFYSEVWVYNVATGQQWLAGPVMAHNPTISYVGKGGDRSISVRPGNYLVHVNLFFPGRSVWYGWVGAYVNFLPGYWNSAVAPVGGSCDIR